MDNKEKSSDNGEKEKENIERRIGEMKKQFQKSYEIFIKANVELSKLSFDGLKQNFPIVTENLSNLNANEVDEILTADTVDDSIKILQSKISDEDENLKNSFPDISKLLKIMSNLKIEMDGLKEKQDSFAKLTTDVNEEMNRFEREIEIASNQFSELTGDHSDEEQGVDADDEISDTLTNQLEDENFDSEFYSD